MQTRLIEIIPDVVEAEEGWADWATRNLKENNWKAAGAAFAIRPIIPVGVGAVAVGAGLVSGVQNGVARLRGTDAVEKLEYSKAEALRDEQGLPVQLNRTYAFHPDETRLNYVISASELHDLVVSEQIADLVSFIRSSVRAVSIEISVESERSGKAVGGFLSLLKIKAEGGVAKHYSVRLRYSDPEVITSEERPFWLRLFPEIVAAFKDARKGCIKRTVSVDTSFGLSASVAKRAGIDLGWLGKQKFNIEAKFI